MVFEINEKIDKWENLINFIDTNVQSNNTNSIKVVIDIYGPFCGPCKKVEKFLEEIENDNSQNLCVLKMNISRLNTKEFMKELIQTHRVMSVPKVLLYKFDFDKKELLFLKNIVSFSNKKALEKEIFNK